MQTLSIDIANAINTANTLLPKKPVMAEGNPTEAGAPFSGVFKEAMSNLESLEQQASREVEGLIAGRGVDVHEAMIATQKSDLAFEMALAVRGKMVSAYQSVMGVQF